MTRKTTLATLAVGALAGTTLIAAPAQAAPESSPQRSGNHCVADLADRTGGSLNCYGTKADAERAVAGQRGFVPLVIFFDKTGYAGKSLTLGHSNGDCSRTLGDVDYAHPNLGVFGWNNRAGSFVTRNHCDLKGFDGKSYRAASFKRWVDHDIRLVRWNNDISSFKLS